MPGGKKTAWKARKAGSKATAKMTASRRAIAPTEPGGDEHDPALPLPAHGAASAGHDGHDQRDAAVIDGKQPHEPRDVAHVRALALVEQRVSPGVSAASKSPPT